MRLSHSFSQTSKTTPADDPTPNARLLTQAGFVRREAAGVWNFLPLGWKVHKKIQQIIREEMDAIDGEEVLMPALVPIENWKKTGRDSADIGFNFEDKYILGFSHEEVITPLAKQRIKSYRDLPLCAYQIQTKFRNEARAKSGILRGREFQMKDAYSFHSNQADLENYYQKMSDAYLRVFQRCGLEAFITTASGGIFTKKLSHEFQVLTEAGEDLVTFCDRCGHAQNLEIAIGTPPAVEKDAAELPLEKVAADRENSCEAAVKLFGLPSAAKILKNVIVVLEKEKPETVGISIRGDLNVNLDKAARHFGVEVRPATDEEVAEAGLVAGFISPVDNDKIRFIGDESIRTQNNFNTGANEFKQDLLNANLGRDFDFDEWGDFTEVTAGFGCGEENCDGKIELKKAAEVGNIFDLATTFSDAFDLKFTDADGKEKPVLMGCYGIGVSRILAVVAEIHHDEAGLAWPENLAPAAVHLISLGKDDAAKNEAEKIYERLQREKIEVIFDDRETGAGSKFADADLIGCPLRVVVSPKTLEAGGVEIKKRKEAETAVISVEELVKYLKK